MSSDESSSGNEGVEDAENNEEGIQPKRKWKEHSPVWECGGVMVKDGAKCTICGKVYKTQTRNTSNLINHILTKHNNVAQGKKLKLEMEKRRKQIEEKEQIKVAKKAEKKKIFTIFYGQFHP